METANEANNYSFYVGTYTDAESEGIYKYLLQNDGTLEFVGLAAKSVNPSFLAISKDKNILIAVNEVDINKQGGIESFAIQGDTLFPLSHSTTGGAHPCFVSTNKKGYVLTANYTGGNVGLHRLNQNGELGSLLDVQQHSGSGTTERQDAAHAHSAWFDPANDQIIAVDLGSNELWFSQLDTMHNKFVVSNPDKLQLKAGAGPRHLVFHPNGKWIYVLNELNNTVSILQRSENGVLKVQSSISTLTFGFNEFNTAADIHISSDGTFVYASNRGHNSLVIYQVNEAGSLKLISHQSTHGKDPRNFCLSPDENYVLVANQNSHNIVSFKRNKSTGLLEYLSEIDAPSPVCIVFK